MKARGDGWGGGGGEGEKEAEREGKLNTHKFREGEKHHRYWPRKGPAPGVGQRVLGPGTSEPGDRPHMHPTVESVA